MTDTTTPDPGPAGSLLDPDTGAKARNLVRTVSRLATAVLAVLTAAKVRDLSVATAVVAGTSVALETALYRLTYGKDA